MKAALVGRNIAYSLSPTIHQYISEKYSLGYHYIIIDTADFRTINLFDYYFLNVTVPYKESMLENTIKEEAVKAISATNLIIPKNNQLYSYNTDYLGFLELLRINNIDYHGKNIFILGYGGAAKAICYALKNENITVVVRNESLKKPQIFTTYDNLKNTYPDIIINTTPNNAKLKKALFNKNTLKDAILIDINYHPSPTYLMQHFKKSLDGLDMLIAQAFFASQLAFNNDKIKYELEDKIKLKELL